MKLNIFKELSAFLLILLLQFSTLLPFASSVEPVAAADSCSGSSASASGSGSKARVGGVALDQAAKFLANMTDITGAYYDAGKDRIVFVGKTNTLAPKFDKDDLAVAIKVIVFEGKLPTFSLEDHLTDSTSFAAEYSTKTLQDTRFGKVMFDADVDLKEYVAGYDTSDNQISSRVSGYKSHSQLYVEYRNQGYSYSETESQRFWITPQYISLKRDDANSAFVFDSVKMQVKTENLQPDNGQALIKASEDFAKFHTDHFDEFAQETPSYAAIKQIGKIAAVVKWIKDSDVATDFFWARDHTPKIVPTPRSFKKFPWKNYSLNNGGSVSIQGGADLITPNQYSPDSTGSSIAVKNSAQAVPTTKEDIRWTFNKDGQAYEAVAVAADAFRSVGSYDTASKDMSYPTAGDLNLSFSRSYSSYSGGQQGVGRGWSIFPARLMETHLGWVVNCNGVSYPHTLGFNSQGGGWESFVYNCATGAYIPEDPAYHSKVFRNGDGTFTARLKDQSELSFDSQYKLKNVKDKNGNLVNYNYDSSNKLTSIADTKNHAITLSYNSQNWVAEARDWTNRTVKYSYDDQGNLLNVTDPNNNVTTYTYDSNYKLISVKDRNGQIVLTNTYTDEAKLATSKNAVNKVTSYNYDKVNRVVTATDNQSPARTQITKHDAKARVLEQTDPLLYKLIYTYGVEFAPLTIKDRNNVTITNTYDANGNLTSVTYPDSKKVINFYDAANRLIKTTDERFGTPGKETIFTYDAKGNLKEINEAGRKTVYTYDVTGEALTLVDPLIHTTTWTRDTFGNKLTEKDATNNATTFEYDGIGRLKKQTDADAKIRTYTYDNNGNVLALNDGIGTTANTYDKENRLIKTTLPDNTVTEFTYNPLGTLTATKDQVFNTTSYGYDIYQNLTTQTDPQSKITTNIYDALNRHKQSSTPMGKLYKYEYDGNGNVTKRIDANNSTTAYTYDAFNRLTQITYPDTKTVKFTYDNRGNRTQMVDVLGTSTYIYDNFNRLIQSTNAYGKILKYTYDSANNVKSITYPDSGAVNYTYDNNNRLISVVDLDGKTTTYTYNKNGTVATRTLPNSIKTIYSYDSAARVSSISHEKSTTIVAKFVYTRNPLGNITGITESGTFVASAPQTTAFIYDALGRITKATYPGNKVFEYTYDKMGNRLTQKVNNSTLTTYAYDNDYKLIQKNNLSSFAYDGNGNQTKKPSGNFNPDPIYGFDFENRMTTHTTSAGDPYDYKYDGMGNRLRRHMQTAVTRYVYDNSGPLSRLMATSGDQNYATTFWIYGLGLIKDGDGRYHLEDASGNMRFTTSSSGSRSTAANYDPFGNTITSSGILPEFQFNQQHFDDHSGMYYLRARYYDPETGRFISRDPVKGSVNMPQTQNPYAYSLNNPINFSDPSGLTVNGICVSCSGGAGGYVSTQRCIGIGDNWQVGGTKSVSGGGNPNVAIGIDVTWLHSSSAKKTSDLHGASAVSSLGVNTPVANVGVTAQGNFDLQTKQLTQTNTGASVGIGLSPVDFKAGIETTSNYTAKEAASEVLWAVSPAAGQIFDTIAGK